MRWFCSPFLHYFLVFMIILYSVCHVLNCHRQDDESVSYHRCWQQTNLLLWKRKLQSIDKWMFGNTEQRLHLETNSLSDVLEFRLRISDVRNDFHPNSNKNINCFPLALPLVPHHKPCSFNSISEDWEKVKAIRQSASSYSIPTMQLFLCE